MRSNSDNSDTKKSAFRNSRYESWSKQKYKLQIIGVDTRLRKAYHKLTECHAIYRDQRESHFENFKAEDNQYPAQFQFGTREPISSIIYLKSAGKLLTATSRKQTEQQN